MMSVRTFLTALALVGGIVATHEVKPKNAPAPQLPLAEFPSDISSSHSTDRPFEIQVVRTIGADDYINRVYAGSGLPIELYIAYYRDQRTGDRIHSPKNCLPGSGWEPIHSTRIQIGSVEGTPVVVNAFLVGQGAKRDMVLYWYQSHGRIIASEYSAKFWLVADALNHRSADGAIVRIWTTAIDGETNSQARAVEFARHVYPQVAGFLPD
jgi:EpsI family protein